MGVKPDIIQGEPEIVDPSQGENTRTKPDSVDRLLGIREKILEQNTVLELSRALTPNGGREERPAPASPLEFKANMDLGSIVSQSMKLATDMVEKNSAMQGEMYRDQLSELRSNLSAIQEKLENPEGKDRSSPFEHYRQIKGFLDDMVKDIRQQSGLSAGPSDASQLPMLLGIKKIEMEHSLAMAKFQAEENRKAREHDINMKKWEAEREEDRNRWAAEYKLKVGEAEASRATKARAFDALGDLMSAWASSVDGGMADVSAQPAGAGVSSKPMPREFKCDSCGSVVPLNGIKPGQHVTCETCNTEYEINADA